jgi:hypothetical protein
MSLRRYLPSAQLALIVCSLAASGGLVYAAEYVTAPHQTIAIGVNTGVSTPANATNSNNSNWEATLYSIQAQNASTSLSTPNPETVQQMLQAVQSSNLTNSIGQTILINLSNAKSQGLGDDIPTQDQIVTAATQQIQSQQASASSYTATNLTIVPTSNNTLHAYGNSVMQTLSEYPGASEQATFLAIDEIVEGGDKTQAATLTKIGAAYKAAALALLAVPVPETFVPLHLEIINTLIQISATYEDMQTIGDDSIRGLVGFKTYESLMGENAQVFTNIAQELSKDGILFTKDEPGSAWGAFLSPQ